MGLQLDALSGIDPLILCLIRIAWVKVGSDAMISEGYSGREIFRSRAANRASERAHYAEETANIQKGPFYNRDNQWRIHACNRTPAR